jgi:hypothetical protein
MSSPSAVTPVGPDPITVSQSTRLAGELDRVRALARRRAHRVQRPLFWGGLAIGLSGVVVAVATGRFPIGGPQMAFGPWLMLLSVMPTDRRAIRTALCTWLVLLCAAGAMQILTLGTCTAPPACELYQIGEVYSLVVLGGNVLYASVLLVALLSGDGSTPGTALSGRAPRWLPLRQSRALLHATWRYAAAAPRPRAAAAERSPSRARAAGGRCEAWVEWACADMGRANRTQGPTRRPRRARGRGSAGRTAHRRACVVRSRAAARRAPRCAALAPRRHRPTRAPRHAQRLRLHAPLLEPGVGAVWSE